MFHLMLMRLIVIVFTMAAGIWYDVVIADYQQHQWLVSFGLGFSVFIALQWWIFKRLVFKQVVSDALLLFFQFLSDVILVSTLIFITGGVQSPFILLLGLVVVAAGTQANAMVVIAIAVSSCAAFLTTIYAYAWWQHVSVPADATLSLLLQISVLMLIGGIMAVIANRQSGLQIASRQVFKQHRQLQEIHSRLLASMNEGVVVLGKDLSIQDSNQAARQILRLNAEFDALSIRDIWPMSQRVLSFLETGKGDMFKCEWQVEDDIYYISVRKLPGNDSLSYWLMILVDVSELKQLESQLMAQEKLAAMGRMAAMLAHEIRNPMQTVSQAVDLFGKLDEEQHANIKRIIQEEIKRLNCLVGDMLDFTRPLKPENQWVRIHDLVESSIQQIDMDNKHQIEVSVDIDEMMVDAQHFRLVLDNVLRNAVQASPEVASVKVSLRSIGEEHWQLQVDDGGGGIPEEVADRIFEPFVTQRSGGTGLGLATVWQSCQANGWDIDVANTSRGTRIVVTGEQMTKQHQTHNG